MQPLISSSNLLLCQLLPLSSTAPSVRLLRPNPWAVPPAEALGLTQRVSPPSTRALSSLFKLCPDYDPSSLLHCLPRPPFLTRSALFPLTPLATRYLHSHKSDGSQM